MKFKPSFELRDVCGENVLIANGIENIDFGALINLNETAADVYRNFAGKDFTLEEVVTYLTGEYDVTADQAATDAVALFESLKEAGVLE